MALEDTDIVPFWPTWKAALILAAAITMPAFLAGCGEQTTQQRPTPEVGVVTVAPQSAALTAELAGRTSPYAVSEIRPQVNGIIKARLFKEGANVKAGDVLYQIDPAPYQAALDSAKAQLASAKANVVTLKAKADRFATLLKQDSVARQDYDDAVAAYQQAVAAVQQEQAAVETAQINLGYTKVTSPISGRVGVSTITAGALVTASQSTALTTVSTLDPIYVDVEQSSAELLKLRRAMAQGHVQGADGKAEVSLKLEDGSAYAHSGALEVTDVTVDQNTGAVTIRAVFPNPEGLLLPGMYVAAVVPQGSDSQAILAPQQGVARNERGQPTAMVVGPDNKVEVRILKVERSLGDKWLVTDGLKPGDQLIVEGTLKAQPGMVVKPVPAGSQPASQPQSGGSQPAPAQKG